MANIFTGTLGFFQDGLNNWWEKVKDAPPSVRYFDMAYAPIYRKNGAELIPVGSFVAEILELANIGALKCQVEAKEWMQSVKPMSAAEYRNALKKAKPTLYHELYRKDGTLKTPFELAVVPSHRIADVEAKVKREFKFQRDRQAPLPALIPKFQIIEHYLREGVKADLVAKEYVGIKINVKNPSDKTPLREKLAHYASQWAAWGLSLAAGVGVACADMALGLSAPLTAVTVLAATYLAKKHGNDFYTFDIVEFFLRETRTLSSKELSRKGTLDFSKTLWTVIHYAAIGFTAYGAAFATWGATLALPWMALGSIGLSAAMIGAAQVATAGCFTAVAALGTWMAGAFTIRYFDGLSVYDTQVKFAEPALQAAVKALPAIVKEKSLSGALKRMCDKTLYKISKERYRDQLSPEDLEKMQQSVKTMFNALQKHAKVAANDARGPDRDYRANPRRTSRKMKKA